MKNSADLGECYPPQPLASVDTTLLDLQNSSYPTQPHSLIATLPITLQLLTNTQTKEANNEINAFLSTGAIAATYIASSSTNIGQGFSDI